MFADGGKSFDMVGGNAGQIASARRATARGSGAIVTALTAATGAAETGDFANSFGRSATDAVTPSSLAKNCFRDGSWLTGRVEVGKITAERRVRRFACKPKFRDDFF